MSTILTTVGAVFMSALVILSLLLGLGIGVLAPKDKIKRDCNNSGRIVLSEGVAYTCAPEKRP